MIVAFEELRNQIEQAFAAVGMNGENAAQMANVMTTAEARGVYSHGVQLVPQYLSHIHRGFFQANPVLKVIKESDSMLYVDGDRGLGAIVLTKACDLLIEKSKKTGSASLGVIRAGHFGAGAYYVERAAAQGQIAYLYGNTGKSAAPFGGRGRYLGTNPYSFSAPAGRYGQVTLDMATTEVAASKLSAAIADGVAVKEGCGIDAEGNPTTDPKAILNGGSLSHFGGAKGYGIAFMVNIVAGVLTGAAFKGDDPDLFGRAHDEPNTGFFMTLTDIRHLMPVDVFTARMEELISDIKTVSPAPGFREVCFPGEIENRNREQSLRDGITVHDAAYEKFLVAMNEYGVR